MDQAVKATTIRTGKYLTFSLEEEEYGIGILKVKEIIGMMPITPVPKTPGFVKGVINLRGKVIPIIDLRVKFDMESKDYTERTCIIVVEIEAGEETVLTTCQQDLADRGVSFALRQSCSVITYSPIIRRDSRT